MAKGTKKPRATHLAGAELARVGNALVVPVVRDQSGNTTMRLDTGVVRGAERTLGVECAFARERHGLLELVFVQLDPFADEVAARVAVVRYTAPRFFERAEANEPFRMELEQDLESKLGGRGERGRYTKLAGAARSRSSSGYSVVIEAELEVIMYSAQRAAMIFLSASAAELGAVARGAAQSLALVPHLEVTISAPALADLLDMWKTLAATLPAATS